MGREIERSEGRDGSEGWDEGGEGGSGLAPRFEILGPPLFIITTLSPY